MQPEGRTIGWSVEELEASVAAVEGTAAAAECTAVAAVVEVTAAAVGIVAVTAGIVAAADTDSEGKEHFYYLFVGNLHGKWRGDVPFDIEGNDDCI